MTAVFRDEEESLMVTKLSEPTSEIKEKTDFLVGLFTHKPEAAQIYLPSSRAHLTSGLAVRVELPEGHDVSTDMPIALGGDESAPTPGSLFAAAVSSCLASVIAMRAAACGVDLTELDVDVSGVSDARGLLGVSDVSAGFAQLTIVVGIAAGNATRLEVEEIVSWAKDHSPVLSTIGTPTVLEIAA
jgi:uncharacterized OsmC-like protein